MMAIEIPPRPTGGANLIPPGARVMRTQARPLTGLEIGKCVRASVEEAAKEVGATDEQLARLMGLAEARLANERWANVEHLTWPSVRWLARVSMSGDDIWADVVVQLSEATRAILYIGEQKVGEGFREVERGQEQSSIPDDVRARWGLTKRLDYAMASGERGHIEVGAPQRAPRELPGPHEPAPVRVARSVDVGKAAPP